MRNRLLAAIRPRRKPGSVSRGWQIGSLLAAVALLTACATPRFHPPKPAPALQASEVEQQRSDALLHRLAQQQRLQRVAWPLLTANTELCGTRVKPALGVQFANSYSFEVKNNSSEANSALRDTALRTLQLGEALQILSVVPGSAAEHAGIEPGDRLVSIGPHPFKTGRPALQDAATALRQLEPGQPTTLVVYRQQRSVELTLTPTSACDYPVILKPGDQINAFADHRHVRITEGMLGFTESDRDLALVIAHELAHNLLGHIPATARNALIGSSIDLLLLSQGIPSPAAFTLGGAASYAQAFEAEADYIALYLLARAGYPIDGSAEFWRRMSRSRPDHISTETGQSHPGSAERYLKMRATRDEIEHKRAKRLPLTPERAS